MDAKALPDDHFFKPLETRLLEMCEDTHPAMRVLMGNAVAALRVFAGKHLGEIMCSCLIHCESCGQGLAWGSDEEGDWEWHRGHEEAVVFCPDCRASRV
jgi:hypothetical protein